MSVTVTVPATTANLGPGFDCLGMALGLENRLTLAVSDQPRVVVQGEGEHDLSRSPSNFAYRAARVGYTLSGREAPPFALTLHNAIPLARGLGSSSAAIVGGLLAGATAAGLTLTREELARQATAIEGHPDNVAPAIYGGCTVAVLRDDAVFVANVPVPAGVSAVVFVPTEKLATKHARAVLPKSVPRADAVFNVGRVALLVAALATGRRDLLAIGAEDRLHQPYRAPLVPGMGPVLRAAAEAGALMTALSGAGPSLLALVDGDPAAVSEAMRHAAADHGIPGATLALAVQQTGARVIA